MSPLNQLPLELRQWAGFVYCYIRREAKHSSNALPGRFNVAGLISYLQESNRWQLSKLCSPNAPQIALIKEGFKLPHKPLSRMGISIDLAELLQNLEEALMQRPHKCQLVAVSN